MHLWSLIVYSTETNSFSDIYYALFVSQWFLLKISARVIHNGRKLCYPCFPVCGLKGSRSSARPTVSDLL